MVQKRKVIRWFFSRIDRFAFSADLKRRFSRANNRILHYDKNELTKEEKIKVKTIWGKWGGDHGAFGFYKKFCGSFNPEFVPNDYYDFAEHVLDLRWSAFFLQHKCNLKYIIPKKNRAEVILQVIDGHIVLEDNTEVSKQDAISILKKNPVFVAKRARGTGGGKGVKKIQLEDIPNIDEYLDSLLSNIDMEFEKIIVQNDFLSQFNPDSVNTIRFLTLNINGNCSVLSAFMRIGGGGSFVDNVSSGYGVAIGVNAEGYLNAFGVDHQYGKRTESSTGVKFEGVQIPDYERIKEQIIEFHRRIPFANLIGWDVTLDKDMNPIVIEVNLDSAVIEIHQIFNGPVFGDRLREVMDYVEVRTPLLRHSMIIY